MLPSDFSWWSSRKWGCCLHGRCCWQLLLDCHQLLKCFPPSLPGSCSCHLSWKGTGPLSCLTYISGRVLIDLAGEQGEQVEQILGVCVCKGRMQTWVWLVDLIPCGVLGWSCVLMQAAKQGRNLLQLTTLYGLPLVSAASLYFRFSMCRIRFSRKSCLYWQGQTLTRGQDQPTSWTSNRNQKL